MKKTPQGKNKCDSIYSKYIKRIFDIVFSGFALLMLWPVLAIIGIIIKITDPGPILFAQKRVGIKKNGENTVEREKCAEIVELSHENLDK